MRSEHCGMRTCCATCDRGLASRLRRWRPAARRMLAARPDVGSVNLLPKVEQSRAARLADLFGRQGRVRVAAGDRGRPGRARTAQCATAAADAPPADAAPRPEAPLVPGGIALQMTECDVVRRAGAPEQVEIGANERGERAVVLTYMRGPRPGIYRFAGGRLVSIERAPGAAGAAKAAEASKASAEASARSGYAASLQRHRRFVARRWPRAIPPRRARALRPRRRAPWRAPRPWPDRARTGPASASAASMRAISVGQPRDRGFRLGDAPAQRRELGALLRRRRGGYRRGSRAAAGSAAPSLRASPRSASTSRR